MSEVDIIENCEVLVDASRGAWDIDADELLLTTLSELQERFLERLNKVRKDVDCLTEDVRTVTTTLQNTVNDFIQLSHNQFVENRCSIEDDEKSTDSEKESEPDAEERTRRLFNDAVDMCVTTLEERTIPLFEGDEDDEEEHLLRDHYRHRIQLALIGTEDFLADPHCGLKGNKTEIDGTDGESSDSEAEPITMQRHRASAPINANTPLYVQTGVSPSPQAAPPLQTAPHPEDAAHPAVPSPPGYRDRIERFYMKYNPERIHDTDAILKTYAGKEEALMKALVKKYGPEPAGGAETPGNTFSKKAFGAESSSDEDAAPRKAPSRAFQSVTSAGKDKDAASKKPAQNNNKQLESSSNDSDNMPQPKKGVTKKETQSAFPKKVPPSKKTDTVVSSSSDSDEAAKPVTKRFKQPPAKKAVSSSSSSDGEKPPKPFQKKVLMKKSAPPVSSSSDSEDASPPPKVSSLAKKAPAKKPVRTSSEDETPKPAPKIIAKKASSQMPLKTDSDSEQKSMPKILVKTVPEESSEDDAPKAAPKKALMKKSAPPISGSSDSEDASPPPKVSSLAKKAPAKKPVTSSEDETPKPAPKIIAVKAAPQKIAARDSDSNEEAPKIAKKKKEPPPFLGKKIVIAKKAIVSDSDSDDVKPIQRKTMMPRPKVTPSTKPALYDSVSD